MILMLLTVQEQWLKNTRFEGGIFGSPGKSNSNNVGFSLSNTFEAKVTDKDSTKTEPKKIHAFE